MINCKVELKLTWTKYCVLSENGNDNNNDNDNNIIFTIEDTKLYVLVVTLSARYNQKLSKLLSKGFERSTNEYRYFLESNFVGVNRLFVLVFSSQDNNSKRFKYLLKGIIDNCNVIINEKKICDQPIDFDIKRYEEIRKLTLAKGED